MDEEGVVTKTIEISRTTTESDHEEIVKTNLPAGAIFLGFKILQFYSTDKLVMNYTFQKDAEECRIFQFKNRNDRYERPTPRIREMGSDIIIIDEAAHIDSELFFTSIYPKLHLSKAAIESWREK